MPRRLFLPPETCDKCHQRPAVGHPLWHSGIAWLCPACLANDTPGFDIVTKMGSKAVQAEECQVLSRRAKAAGEIQEAADYEKEYRWHGHAAISIKGHGYRLAKESVIVSGEAVTPNTREWVKDTLANPDLIALDASSTRGNLLLQNGIMALGVDISNTVGAANTAEKLLSHEIALAHKIAFEQAAQASSSHNPTIELKRLQVSARMMQVAQQGILALQKIKTGGTQNVVVQHVHVEQGGQAIVGNVERSRGQGEG